MSERQSQFPLLAPQYAEIAVNNVEDAIVLLASHGPSLTVEYVNRGFEKIFGYTRAEIVGQPVGILAREGHEPDGLLRLGFDATKPHRAEAMLKTKDGNDILVELDIQSVEIEGVIGGLMVMRDVTEYRRLEHIAAASEVSESVGYVFAGIRHELGNPVNSLKAALTLLSDPTVDLSREKHRDYLLRALREVQRMEQLLAQLRTFNANESAQLGRIDVRPFLERFIRLARSDCAARATQIELEPGPDATIWADDRILHQILLLLLTNALDAVETAPERVIRLACQTTPRSTRILLVDSGVGMTPEQCANAERPFVTSKANGTGLGLPLARRYASLTKCTFELSSALGKGTTSTLVFERINSSEIGSF